MRKALATIGLVAALAAVEPIASEAGGRMGGGQQWRGHSGHSQRSNHFRYPYYYRPYYYPPYFYSSMYYLPQVYGGAYGGASGYTAPAYDYGTPLGAYSAPAAPQFQTEVVFPEGRYYLQGDGGAVPYRWVWVPNPPAAPPADEQDLR